MHSSITTTLRGYRALYPRLSEWLDRAAQEGRAALESLRATSSEDGDLLDSFRLAFAECSSMHNFHAAFQQSGRIRELHQIVRGEVYRIGYEAIQNACVHSGGDHLTVGLEYDQNLVLRVLDNGGGITMRTSPVQARWDTLEY